MNQDKVNIGRLALLLSLFLLFKIQFLKAEVDPARICAQALTSPEEKLWLQTTQKPAPSNHVQIHFKRQDYNQVLYFLNSLGGVTQLPTYFSKANPNALITVIPLRENRKGLSEDYIEDFAPWSHRYFNLVLNFSREEKYNPLTSSAERVALLTSAIKRPSGEPRPSKGLFSRWVGAFQSLDEKLMGTADLVDPNVTSILEQKPLLESLTSISLEESQALWTLVFVDSSSFRDLEGQLTDLGYNQSIRVIDHIVVE